MESFPDRLGKSPSFMSMRLITRVSGSDGIMAGAPDSHSSVCAGKRSEGVREKPEILLLGQNFPDFNLIRYTFVFTREASRILPKEGVGSFGRGRPAVRLIQTLNRA